MPPTTTINQWCMDLLIYGTVREVWADQEGGTAEVIIKPRPVAGFFVCGEMGRFIDRKS